MDSWGSILLVTYRRDKVVTQGIRKLVVLNTTTWVQLSDIIRLLFCYAAKDWIWGWLGKGQQRNLWFMRFTCWPYKHYLYVEEKTVPKVPYVVQSRINGPPHPLPLTSPQHLFSFELVSASRERKLLHLGLQCFHIKVPHEQSKDVRDQCPLGSPHKSIPFTWILISPVPPGRTQWSDRFLHFWTLL